MVTRYYMVFTMCIQWHYIAIFHSAFFVFVGHPCCTGQVCEFSSLCSWSAIAFLGGCFIHRCRQGIMLWILLTSCKFMSFCKNVLANNHSKNIISPDEHNSLMKNDIWIQIIKLKLTSVVLSILRLLLVFSMLKRFLAIFKSVLKWNLVRHF